MDTSIGNEEEWTKKAVEKMVFDKAGPTFISYLTTDRDSSAARGARSGQMRPVVNLHDTQHLGKAVVQAVRQCKFSDTMLGRQPIVKKDKLKTELARDIKRRCEAEFNRAFCRYDSDVKMIKWHLSHTTNAILECVAGNCGKSCKKWSVCSGKKLKKWPHNYLQFSVSPQQSLEMTTHDKLLLQQCLDIRLSPSAIDKQLFKTSTQKTESTHRTYSKTNNRLITLKRNFSGRIHSGVHVRNHGIPESTVLKCEAVGSSLSAGTKVARSLKRSEHILEKHKARFNTLSYKQARAKSRAVRYAAYSLRAEIHTYKKDMLAITKKAVRFEHSYATRHNSSDHSYSKV